MCQCNENKEVNGEQESIDDEWWGTNRGEGAKLDMKLRTPILARQTTAVLSLTGLAVFKVLLFLLLLKVGFVHVYVGGNGANIYLPAAKHILTTGTYNDRETVWYSTQAPGYALFIAFSQWIGGASYLTVLACLQMLLDYYVALLLLFLGYRETSIEVGFFAGIVWLLFPPALVISTFVASEALFAMLLVLSIVLLVRSLSQQRGAGLSFSAGLALGLATLVRGITLLLPVVFFAILYFEGLRKGILKCTAFLVGMCMLVLPWAVRNRYVLSEPIIVQSGFGGAFLQGSRTEYFTVDGNKKGFPILFRDAAQEGLVKPNDGKITSFQQWRFNLGLRNYRMRLKQEPWSVAPFLLYKFVRLWYGAESGSVNKEVVLGLCSLLVAPIGMYQIWLWRADRRQLSTVLALLTVYFIVVHWIVCAEFRYVLPICPFLIFAASHQYIKMWKGTGHQELLAVAKRTTGQQPLSPQS